VVPREVDVPSQRLYGPGLERLILGKLSLMNELKTHHPIYDDVHFDNTLIH
jgi:hypothetical protein